MGLKMDIEVEKGSEGGARRGTWEEKRSLVTLVTQYQAHQPQTADITARS